MAKIPTVKMFKGGKLMICNESDVDRFKADGWALQDAPAPAPGPDATSAPDASPKPAKRGRPAKTA